MRDRSSSIGSALITEFFDEANLLILVIAALIAQAMTRETLHDCKWRPGAKLLAWAFFVAYATHLAAFIDIRNDALETIGLVMRAGVVAAIVFHVALLPVAYVAHFCVRFLEAEWQRFRELGRQLTAEHESRTAVVPLEVVPMAAPPREAAIQQTTIQAKMDFDFEREIIETADLDDDEKDAAITEARQKYLQRLRSALQ